MAPDDELWEYGAIEYLATVEASPDRLPGFEQVLDSEALDRIGLLETADRIVGFRGEFAVVRGEEIVDWIESPFWIA
jgi:hypothetical protein